MNPRTIPPLSKYSRMTEVEAELARLETLGFDELIARCEISDRSNPGYIRSESLVHRMRATRSDNNDARFNRLFVLFLRRIARALPRAERTVDGKVLVDAATQDINEAALDRIRLLVTLDRSGGDRLDFYEVHFDEAVAKLRLSARRRVSVRAERETPIEVDDDSGALVASAQTTGAHANDADDAILSDPIFRPRLLAAIDALPQEQKEVITMTLANIPSQSIDPDIASISGLLHCDPRTVHNRRKRAIAALRQALGLGEDK